MHAWSTIKNLNPFLWTHSDAAMSMKRPAASTKGRPSSCGDLHGLVDALKPWVDKANFVTYPNLRGIKNKDVQKFLIWFGVKFIWFGVGELEVNVPRHSHIHMYIDGCILYHVMDTIWWECWECGGSPYLVGGLIGSPQIKRGWFSPTPFLVEWVVGRCLIDGRGLFRYINVRYGVFTYTNVWYLGHIWGRIWPYQFSFTLAAPGGKFEPIKWVCDMGFYFKSCARTISPNWKSLTIPIKKGLLSNR